MRTCLSQSHNVSRKWPIITNNLSEWYGKRAPDLAETKWFLNVVIKFHFLMTQI